MPVPADLSKLSNVVKNDVVKKTAYGKLVAKVNSIDTSGFALKTKYDADKKELENQLLNLKEQVSSYRTMTSELNESLDVATSLLQKEKMINRRLSAELETRHSVNSSLKRSPSDITQKQLQRSESIVNCAPRHKLYNQRQLSYGEMMELINKTTVPQEDEQHKHLAKTLSFQVSFNGVPVHTKNDF